MLSSYIMNTIDQGVWSNCINSQYAYSRLYSLQFAASHVNECVVWAKVILFMYIISYECSETVGCLGA